MAGSIGYAERLSWRDDVGGTLGTPEFQEADDAELQRKIDTLAELIRESRAESGGMVVHTGAGISTSIGIPDFRGPNGVWTAQKRGAPMPEATCTLGTAVPSLTHMALVELRERGYVRYLVSCNVDCLHLRSGFPREDLAELHGNCFAERCERCDAEYVRDFEMQTVGFEYTGRTCDACAEKKRKRESGARRSSRAAASRSAAARLRDQVLDWDDALPPEELRRAEKHSKETCLSLVLGSSLQIAPSCDIPLETVKKKKGKKGKLVIVNLQATPKDGKASLLVRARTDVVMAGVMRRLGLRVPEYVRRDRVTVGFRLAAIPEPNGDVSRTLTVRAGSSHGWDNPVPWLESVSVKICEICGERDRLDPIASIELFDAQTRARMNDGGYDAPNGRVGREDRRGRSYEPSFTRGNDDRRYEPNGDGDPSGPFFEGRLEALNASSFDALLEWKKTRVRVELTFAAGVTIRHAAFWTDIGPWSGVLDRGHSLIATTQKTHSVITSRRRYEDPVPALRQPQRKKENNPAPAPAKQKAPDPVAARIRAAVAMR